MILIDSLNLYVQYPKKIKYYYRCFMAIRSNYFAKNFIKH